jgi:HEAT repeat protein
MTRQEIIAVLVRMLRPLGPDGDPAHREEEEVAWATIAAGDSEILVELLDLMRYPATENERGRVSEEAFQGQLVHVLSLAGASAPEPVVDRVGALTQDLRARATAIEILGAIGDPAGLRWLEPLIDGGDLSDDEATWLACALGDIGTAKAATLLERLSTRMPRDRASVHREIQIARDTMARGSSG